MDKKMTKSIKAVMLLGIYILLFWVGFRSGEIYNRMRNKLKIEKVVIHQLPPEKLYYIVETYYNKGYKETGFEMATDNDVRIKFFLNKKMRPLLRLRDIKIYTQKGDRIY